MFDAFSYVYTVLKYTIYQLLKQKVASYVLNLLSYTEVEDKVHFLSNCPICQYSNIAINLQFFYGL